MSESNPYEKLGVTENASFEDIQRAKKSLTQQYQNNPPVLESIEVAYDTIIMQRLRLRQEGKIKVPEQIRFPDKQTPTKSNNNISNNQATEKISNWFTDLLDQPTIQEIGINGLIFLTLITISIFSEGVENLPLLLTVGVITSTTVLYRKEKLFWRSILITFTSFILGIFVANISYSLIDSAGLAISLSIEKFASLFTFCILSLVCSFTR